MGAEALSIIKESDIQPDLILLDVYIPDSEGLSLFWQVRKGYPKIDIIMLTAAKEVETIEETLRGGIFDYIVKPINFARFEKTLERYKEKKQLLSTKTELEQDDIDRLIGQNKVTGQREPVESFPKGIDQLTLSKINNVLKSSDANGVNALETGEEVGVSRSTARRYLEYLVSVNEAKAQLIYGEVGRPERKYTPWTL